MAEALVTFMLEQLKEVAIGYKDLISGAADDFKGLNDDLDTLRAHLKEMAKRNKDEPSRKLERRIRDTVYDVEDTIDTCKTDAIKANHTCICFSNVNVNLAKEVKLLRKNVAPLIEEAKRLGDGSRGVQDQQIESPRDIPIRQNRVVGLYSEEATIVGYLKERTSSLDVISIVGIPGQGKTTLAWKIYQNDQILSHFTIRIWVYISQTFNPRDVFLQILRKFYFSEDMSNFDNVDLALTVHRCLKNEKFLLVLDDVWSVDAWNKIKEVLPDENVEGKVLITSRDTSVGMKSSVNRGPHTLRFLNEEERKTLLQYEVFGNLESSPENLRATCDNIAFKCDGVPLTIAVLGGIMSDMLIKSPLTVETEWNAIASDVSGTLHGGQGQRILDVVELSYNRLPDDLKECFVFLGVFPEDYAIPAKMLCGLWISEGFIQPKRTKSVEKVAEDNLNELICKNLLMVEKVNYMGKVKTCRVHDIIRAFCVAKSEDENLFQEIKISKTGALHEPSLSEVKKSRRLCFQSDLSRFLSENPVGPKVRSFMCFYDQLVPLEAPQHISVIPDNFPKLRILESKCIKLDQFPAQVTKLIHLRYLTLYIETLDILPEELNQLWNLQSLVVETKSNTVEMKANMWKMVCMKYLKTKAAIVLNNKLQGKAGENLHTLNSLSPESCTDSVSKRAKNLKTLGISGKLVNFFKKDFLQKLHHLEKLKMVNSLTYEQTSEEMLHDLPKYNGFPPNLKRLTLTKTFIGWQHMSTLALIENLEALKLKDNAFVGVSWNVSGYNFPNLRLLLIVNTDLVLWEASADSFPKLKFLVVKTCKNLKKIPECLGTHLEKLEIECLRLSAVQSAQAIAETKKVKPKGKYAAQFNLITGAACMTR